MIFAAILAVIGTFAQTAPGGVAERVVVQQGTGGDLRLRINAGEEISMAALRANGASITRDNVRLLSDGRGLTITSTRRPVTIDFGTMGLVAELPVNGETTLSHLPDLLEFSTPPNNPAPLTLSFHDQGRGVIPPGEKARVEFFRNRTYALSGSAYVTGVSADGLEVKFSRFSTVMTGGPLEEQTDARGNVKLKRGTPAEKLNLSGRVGGEVRIISSAGDLTLAANQEKLIAFANGARVLVRQDMEKSLVHWRVIKGVCHFGIEGFSCWKALAVSGSEGTFRWNAHQRLIDLKSEAAAGPPVLVQLSGRVTASVLPGGTFQYAQFQDCGSFATLGLGDVALHDRESGEVIPVSQGIISYNEGIRAGADAAGGVFPAVALAWKTEARIELRAAGTVFPVSAGTEQTVSLGGSKLAAAHAVDGSLMLRAVEGNYRMEPEFLSGLAIEVPEGGGLVLRLDRQRMLFIAQSVPDSTVEARVISGGQTYMFLSGEARVTVVLGQNSLLPEGSPEWIFFEGAAGETTFTSGPQPGSLITPNRLDASRIVQPAVSVIE